MKKTLAILALLSLATLPSLAEQRIFICGYQIGDSAITANDGRIVATNNVDSTLHYDSIYLSAYRSSSNAYFNVFVPAGQKVVKWVAYNGDPSSRPSPSQTNELAGAATEYVWSYNSKDIANKYLILDFDYITYTLNYNGNGSTSGSMSPTDQCYTNAFKLTANAFAKTGYSFGGWTNKTGTAFENRASVRGSSFGVTYTNKTATLYAKWNPNSYAVRFNKNADDATGSMPDQQQFTYDVAQDLSANGFSRDGYVFSGWTNNTGTAYADGVSVSNLATEEGAVVELFAKWTQLWTIIFQDASQFDFSGFSTNIYENGATISVPSNPSHDGYTFTGWTPSVSLTATGNATYTASYSANSYKVVFHSNYGGDVVNDSMTFKFGSAFNIPGTIQGITSRTGYTLLGWATQSDAQTKEYDPGAQGVLFTTAGRVDLYAVWEPIKYKISFDKNGGEGTMDDIENVSYDVAVALPTCAFEKSGVDFKCWQLGGDSYADGATVSNLTKTANATVTLVAIWSEKCYVAFDANGGAGEMEAQTFDAEDLPASLTSNAFEKVGYTFFGWATNVADAAALKKSYADGQTFETFASLPAAAGETATLYAVWQTNAYTVVFDPNCTSYAGTMADQSFVYDQEQALFTNAFTNLTGLAFAGWTNKVSGATYTNGEVVVNLTPTNGATVTLFAVWDVGELSKAMHCSTLYWTNPTITYNDGWDCKYEDGAGFNADSCVASEMQTSLMVVTVKTNGTLRFHWKSNTEQGPKVIKDVQSIFKFDEISDLTSGEIGEWHDSGEIAIGLAEDEDELEVGLLFDGYNSEMTCYIDQLTWTPEGSTLEPTEENKPTISAFTATAGGFTLRASNVSDSFSYQILATNELVSGDWPVMTNLTSKAIGEGYTIEIDENESQMFYKVKVIAK